MNKSKIFKQEMMAGAAFLLTAFVISWFLFLQKPLNEKSLLGPELQSIQETIKIKEISVSPSAKTVKSAQKLVAPVDKSLIIERVTAAAEKTGLKAKTSSIPQGIELVVYSGDSDAKILFIESLNPGISMFPDGQIKNTNSIPLLKTNTLEMSPGSLKVVISL